MLPTEAEIRGFLASGDHKRFIPAPTPDVTKMTAKDAIAFINNVTDRKLLEEVAKAATRKNIQKAVSERLSALDKELQDKIYAAVGKDMLHLVPSVKVDYDSYEDDADKKYVLDDAREDFLAAVRAGVDALVAPYAAQDHADEQTKVEIIKTESRWEGKTYRDYDADYGDLHVSVDVEYPSKLKIRRRFTLPINTLAANWGKLQDSKAARWLAAMGLELDNGYYDLPEGGDVDKWVEGDIISEYGDETLHASVYDDEGEEIDDVEVGELPPHASVFFVDNVDTKIENVKPLKDGAIAFTLTMLYTVSLHAVHWYGSYEYSRLQG